MLDWFFINSIFLKNCLIYKYVQLWSTLTNIFFLYLGSLGYSLYTWFSFSLASQLWTCKIIENIMIGSPGDFSQLSQFTWLRQTFFENNQVIKHTLWKIHPWMLIFTLHQSAYVCFSQCPMERVGPVERLGCYPDSPSNRTLRENIQE